MNQKGIAKNILVLLLIALVGVVGYLVKADAISWPGWRSWDNGTAGWKMYKNEKYGFELKVPSHYKISSTRGGDIGMSLESDYAFVDFRDLQGIATLSGKKKIVVSGLEGIEIEYPIGGNMDGGIEFEALFRAPSSRNGYLSILFTTTQKGYESKIDEFRKILSTFRFTQGQDTSRRAVQNKSDQMSVGNVRIGSADPLDLDPVVVRELQQEVDSGHQPWRLDPVEVARVDSVKYGFNSDDAFKLRSKEFGEYAGTYIADVEVKHKGELYKVRLIQPGTIGEGGIWVVNSIGQDKR